MSVSCSDDTYFQPYGSMISGVLCDIVNTLLSLRDDLSQRHLCDIIVTYLPVPIAIIIEHGSFETLVTLTSFDQTSHRILSRFPSVVNSKNTLVGNDAIEQSSSVMLARPIRNGIICKQSLLELNKIWNYIFNDALVAQNSWQHAVALIVAPQTLHDYQSCDRMMEIMFHVYNVPALAVLDKASLSCHFYCYALSSHKKNALVVDLGHDITTVTPVFDFQSDVVRMRATKLITCTSLEQYIYHMLKENHFEAQFYQDVKEIDNIKKKHVKIAQSRQEYELILAHSFFDGEEYVTTDESARYWISNWILFDFGEFIFNPCAFPVCYPHYVDVQDWLTPKSPTQLKRFTVHELDKYAYLQQRSTKTTDMANDEDEKNQTQNLKGLADIIYDAIMQFGMEDDRASLWNNIILTGGLSFVPGISTRLKHELMQLIDDHNSGVDVAIVLGPRQDECNSVCASWLTSLTSTATMWLTKEEFMKNWQQN